MAEEKKHGKTGRRVTTVAAAAAVLLLAGSGVRTGGWGLLPGEGDSVLPEKEQTQAVEAVETQEEAETPAEDNILTVAVHENQISFEGEAVTPEELEDALLRAYSEDKEVELVNDNAIKADYDTAAAILDRLNIPYTVK